MGLIDGIGFTFSAVILGAMREILGLAHCLPGANFKFGDWASNWQITLISGR